MPKVREMVRLVEQDGWYHVRTRGSDRQFKHAAKRGTVTIAGRMSKDLGPDTVSSILKQAGLDRSALE